MYITINHLCNLRWSFTLLVKQRQFFQRVSIPTMIIVSIVLVGMRGLAVQLSNPFGNDDVDFPIDKWVAQLRANALLVHRENRVVRKPKGGADFGTGLGADDDDDEEEEDEDGGAGGGAGGDAGGGGGGGDDGDDGDEGEKGF